MVRSAFVHSLVSVAALLGAASLAHAAPASPDDTIRALYKADTPFISGKGESLLDNNKAMAKFLSRAFDKALDADAAAAHKRGEPPTIEGDPFIDAQEADATNIKVSLISSTGQSAQVLAGFDHTGNQHEDVTYSMVMERGLWRIDDISYKRADGSADTVRKDLADAANVK